MTAQIKVEKTSTERSDAEAARAAPVSLPAGSFAMDDLSKDLAEAAKAKNDKNRDELVAKAVEKHNQIGTEPQGIQPGYTRVEVVDEVSGVTETRTVYDPSKAEEAAAAQEGVPAPDAKTEE